VRSWSTRRFQRAVAAISILSTLSLAFLAVGGHTASRAVASTPHMRVTSASDAAKQRIYPSLLQQAQDTPQAMLRVSVYAKQGTDLRAWMPDALAPIYKTPTGYATIVGTVKANTLVKLASAAGVQAVMPLKGAAVPDPMPVDGAPSRPTAAQAAQLNALLQRGVKNTVPSTNAPEPVTDGWYDVLNGHDSSLAWDKGYTGAGVKVMINDSGIDFANPDLMNTWARINDPSSPYNGWPEMFDQFSLYLLARDTFLGESNIADGFGMYIDTSTTVTAGDAAFKPLDADAPYDYSLPGTSKSGTYHIGTASDNSLRFWYRLINGIAMDDADAHDERPAVLVVDEHTAGVYDTVYIDLDFDHDFANEKAMRKGDEISGADYWGAYDVSTGEFAPDPDGFYDESGGLLYWIADGTNPPPTADWWWGIGAAGNGQHDAGEPGSGNMIALSTTADLWLSEENDHGTLCASAVAGQGILNADSAEDEALPGYKPAGTTGMVTGAGKNVKLVSAGDFYSYLTTDAFYFAALGYDGVPGNSDDVQISSNSWGISEIHNDGWDFMSREIDAVVRLINPSLLVFKSTGNGAPGFGTTTQPSPMTGINVGASTQYGSTTVFEPIEGADQIIYGDVMSWSGRGPGARGDAGVDLLANGAWGAGDLPLNLTWSGASSWYTWGGTSRSTPTAAGNAALMYQAYKQANGGWPDYDTARAILMSSTRDLHYDPFLQGTGSVNGNRAVDVASGLAGGYVTPSTWQGGDYHGNEWPGFTNIMHPGDTDSATFSVHNNSDQQLNYTIGDRWLQRMDAWQLDFTSAPIDEENLTYDPDDPSATVRDGTEPHYLWDVTDMIPEGTDVLVASIAYPYDQFDPELTYDDTQINDWRILVYDWTDLNGDGKLWNDLDNDGVVDEGEMERGEYNRFTYGYNDATTNQVTIQTPLVRKHDGIFLGLIHDKVRVDVPQTNIHIGMDFYQQQDMPWLSTYVNDLSVAPGDTNTFTANLAVPGDTPAGIYEGALVLNDGYWVSTVPVTINVAGTVGLSAGENAGNGYYDNGRVYGAQSWGWRAESGDWRFYFADLSETPGGIGESSHGMRYFMASASWEHMPSDVNIHIFGPTADCFSNAVPCDGGWYPSPQTGDGPIDPDYYGPYTLTELGGSEEGYIGGGVFLTTTSSGENHEFVAAPYVPGLNEIALDNVNFAGESQSEQITLDAGALAVSQAPIEVSRPSNNADYYVHENIESTMPLSGLVVDGFGMSAPDVKDGLPIEQDDPNDPSTADYRESFTVDHAGLLDVSIAGQEGTDIDLYMLYDFNGDGELTFDEVFAASTSGTPNEGIRVLLPPDGLYGIAVHGWNVPTGSSTFQRTLNLVQGHDIQVSGVPSGPIEPRQHYGFNVNFSLAGAEPGTYTGLVTLGPPEGPAAVLIPVTFEVRGE